MSIKIKISIFTICFALVAAVCVGFAFAAPSEKLNLKGTLSYEVPRPVVMASPNDSSLGSTTGSGDYSIGETVTLTATKKSGSTFLAWATSTDPNEMEILSTSPRYSFEFLESSPKDYYALFNKATSPSQTDGNLIYTFYEDAKLASVTDTTSTDLSGALEIRPVVKSDGNSYKVFSIGNSAFYYCDNLTSITISEGVTSIGNSAFQLCSNLTSVSLPSTLTSIGNSAFQSCSSLTEIEIPEEVTSIGERAFRYCDNLTSITIPEGVTLIGNNAFQLCSNLTSVSLPSTLTSIGENAFESCSSLTTITIPKGVTSIGDGAFRDCTGLTSASLPNTLTSINNRAFYGCSQLTTITIPEGVTSIGDSAFQSCSSLTSVSLPTTLTSISSIQPPFSQCCALVIVYNNSRLNITAGSTGNGYVGYYAKEIVASGEEAVGKIETEGNVRYYVNGATNIAIAPSVVRGSLTSVTIREGTTEIGYGAFMNCSSLTSITIPEEVTEIDYGAFWGTSLTSITINGNISSLGTSVFAGCGKLTSLTLGAEVTSLPSGLFTGSNLTELTEIEVLGNLTSTTFPSGTWYKGDSQTPVRSFDGEGVYTRTDI